jgi:excisionase family DNA binding protein
VYDEDSWLTVDECAARLGITVERVRELVAARVLRARRDGMLTLVEPALVPGYTT